MFLIQYTIHCVAHLYLQIKGDEVLNKKLIIRKMLPDFLLNFIGLVLLVLPDIICYSIMTHFGEEFAFSPIPIKLFVPFYILWVNIKGAKNNGRNKTLWRVFSCVLIAIVGYILSYLISNFYYIGKGASGIDQMTEMVLHLEFVYNVMVLVFGIAIYQIKLSEK